MSVLAMVRLAVHTYTPASDVLTGDRRKMERPSSVEYGVRMVPLG